MENNPTTLRAPLKEATETSIRKDGISYVFESRSVSAVIDFVYTPIDGTFSDIELEINGAPPIKPADEGGLIVEMGGRVHPADSDEIERHFISCEQLEDCVEARWQWVFDEEIANFLYRFKVVGKSLEVELEGGNGKACGLTLGRVIDAVNPKLITIPYFNFGDHHPRLLSTGGAIISSFVDWNYTNATSVYSVDKETAERENRLNGGCSYKETTQGVRAPLQDKWVLTVSTNFDEAFPRIEFPAAPQTEAPTWVTYPWYTLATLEPSEESYVEVYETLRTLKQLGINKLLVNHPAETWHDGGGASEFSTDAAPIKGGDDALSEYIEALDELGFQASLQTGFRHIAATDPECTPTNTALTEDSQPTLTGSGTHLFKPTLAAERCEKHIAQLVDKFQPAVPYITSHAALPPWDFADCDYTTDHLPTLPNSLELQRNLLATIGQQSPCIGDGGNHWLYAGLLQAVWAKMVGENPRELPVLVDFDLLNLHSLHINVGLGSPEDFFGDAIPQEEKNSRSNFLSRYIATTAAFGHAVSLPDANEWGLPSTVKAYFMLQKIQESYLNSPVSKIRYHQNGHFTSLNDALHSGAYELGQLQINYENQTRVYSNLGITSWEIEEADHTFLLPPGSFWASADEGRIIAYSNETEGCRLDYACCDDYLYIDTHGNLVEHGPISLDGAALVKERKWEIDVITMDCNSPTVIDVGHLWPDRKLPPLRLLAFRFDEESPNIYKADMEGDKVRLPNIEGVFMYRITLPEWMVEPGH